MGDTVTVKLEFSNREWKSASQSTCRPYAPTRSVGARFAMIRGFAAVLGCLGLIDVAQAAIGYVQGTYASINPASSVTVTYGNAQQVGDLNVVIVGWYDSTSDVASVVDSQGNNYVRAVGPTKYPDIATQYIYYAKNIVAVAPASNSVTVTFTNSVSYADVRVAEYSGIDAVDPLDIGSGDSGSSNDMSSGFATTANANDLLVGGNFICSNTDGVGTGYTQRMITLFSQIVADRAATTAGSYDASAHQDSACWWVMQMAAFRAATTGGGDTEAPTAPSGLGAIAASSTQINLSWTASTDNVSVTGYKIERCQGAGCSTFTQIATPTGTTYSDTGLTASTSYTYRVRATDAAGNFSPYSSTASATTLAAPDTTAPTPPSGLGATAISGTQINLSWTASTDNVAVTTYLLERCQGPSCTTFAQIAAPSTTTYSDTALTAATSYTYRVRATDAASNSSLYSNIATAATQYAGPITFSYIYDNLGRITHVSGSDGSSIDYQYDANGNVTVIKRQ